MVNGKGMQAASVSMTDGFNAGIHDAMERIKSLNLNSTLVTEISDESWASWDASQEDALAVDSSFEHEIDDEDLIAA